MIKTILWTAVEIRLLLAFTNILLYFILIPKSINLIKSLLHVNNTALVIIITKWNADLCFHCARYVYDWGVSVGWVDMNEGLLLAAKPNYSSERVNIELQWPLITELGILDKMF